MKLLTSAPQALNFQAILDLIPKAKEVFATTYGLGNKAEYNPLLRAIRKMGKDSSVVIITNVANQMLADDGDVDAGMNDTVDNYIAELDPLRFKCAVEAWFCFDNHSKIIIVDEIAYVGSANITLGSKYNFEAGILTDDKETVEDLGDFVAKIRAASVPRSTIQGSRELQILLAFAAKVPELIERFKSEVGEWEIEPWTGDGDYVASADKLSYPEFLEKEVSDALQAIESIDDRTRSNLNPKLPEVAISVKSKLEELSSTLASIDELLPEEISEAALGGSLVEKHLWLSNDGKVDQVVTNAINDEVAERVGENEQKRDRLAKQCFEAVQEELASASVAIRQLVDAPAPHPRLARIKPKHA